MVESVKERPVGSWEAQQAKKRPVNFEALSPRQQWEIDAKLGILDWDGS